VVAPVPQPISKALKGAGHFAASEGRAATKLPTLALIAAAAGQIKSSMWYSAPIGPEKRRSAWLDDGSMSGADASVKEDFPKMIIRRQTSCAPAAPAGQAFRRWPRSHPVVIVVVVIMSMIVIRIFLGRGVIRFDHEMDRHAVQFLEHERAIDH
jgi:hypothetical protein